jgi:hypothetical protein
MRLFLKINNVFLLLGMIGCCAGALAGMIVLLPFVAGAWVLNLMALVAAEESPRQRRSTAAAAAPERKASARRGDAAYDGRAPAWSPQGSAR